MFTERDSFCINIINIILNYKRGGSLKQTNLIQNDRAEN